MTAIARWKGEDISDKSILLWSDQGLGDSIQMARYIPLIKANRIIIYVEAPLFNLMRLSFPSVEVIMKGWAFTKTDYHLPLMSLMTVFKSGPYTIPQGRYLNPPNKDFEHNGFGIEARHPFIGINWQGNKMMSRDMTRSMPLEFMKPIFDCGTIVSLQKGNAQDQLDGLGIIDVMDDCLDLCDTASLIDQLDLVITTDTVIPHLAGALGKKTYLLECFETEWRWGFGPVSPWYESVKIMKQDAPGDWPGAVEKVRKELHDAS